VAGPEVSIGVLGAAPTNIPRANPKITEPAAIGAVEGYARRHAMVRAVAGLDAVRCVAGPPCTAHSQTSR